MAKWIHPFVEWQMTSLTAVRKISKISWRTRATYSTHLIRTKISSSEILYKTGTSKSYNKRYSPRVMDPWKNSLKPLSYTPLLIVDKWLNYTRLYDCHTVWKILIYSRVQCDTRLRRKSVYIKCVLFLFLTWDNWWWMDYNGSPHGLHVGGDTYRYGLGRRLKRIVTWIWQSLIPIIDIRSYEHFSCLYAYNRCIFTCLFRFFN